MAAKNVMLNEKKVSEIFGRAQDRLVLQASDLSLETLAAMVESESIDIKPVFQRRERWDSEKQSALIESFLLNVPIPPVYLSEDDFGTYSVIDGKQRLTAIHRFMRDKLRLVHLESFTELDGARFCDLPISLKNALKVRPYLRVVTLLKQSDPDLKYEVFTRLNCGGEPLNAQEIRNVAYRGPLNDLLLKLSEDPFLRQQLKIRGTTSPAYQAMSDVEFVLRFLTLRTSWKAFSGSLSRSMDGFMRANRYAKKSLLSEFSGAFKNAIGGCQKLWGGYAFMRPADGVIWRNQMLAGMYDAQMVAVDREDPVSIAKLSSQRAKVMAATRELFKDNEFEMSVRQGTNTPSRIAYRIQMMSETLKGL